ncbi:MAG TPA: hypothetical protein VNJ51_11615 [Candidatus Dormibacteraeota bacterium]|nr:hypothetical protein [Candidatus Dormibacteraeota bacterium]
MNETPRYHPLSPAGLAAGFAALGVLASLSMGMPFMYGMGSVMRGPYGGAPGYPHMGWGYGGFGLIGFVWFVAISALGGAIVAWVYNAVIGAASARRHDATNQPLPPTGAPS